MCCRRHTSLGGRWDPQPWLEKQPKQGEQRGGGCRTQPCLRFCAATPRNESKEAKREEKPENKVLSLLPCSRCKRHMAAAYVLLLAALLALASSPTMARDPGALQDLCVADNTSN
ncbi:hypothetical protein GW17_00060682, partial [Ensete ventricosum]